MSATSHVTLTQVPVGHSQFLQFSRYINDPTPERVSLLSLKILGSVNFLSVFEALTSVSFVNVTADPSGSRHSPVVMHNQV